MRTFKLIFFYPSIVNSILFNGSCPSPPESIYTLNETIDYYFIYQSIPFANYPSNLFKNITQEGSIPFSFYMTYNESETSLRLVHAGAIPTLECHCELRRSLVDRFTAKSSIRRGFNLTHFQQVNCHKKLDEVFFIWHEDPFIILWTCNETLGTRDEAVLIAFDRLLEDPYKKLSSRKANSAMAKSMAGKYLSQELMDHIDWYTNAPKDDYDRHEPFKCPSIKYNIPWKLISGLILILTLFAAFLFSPVCQSGASNRIHPVLN